MRCCLWPRTDLPQKSLPRSCSPTWSEAWLAVEDPARPWPALAEGQRRRGPVLRSLDRSAGHADWAGTVALSAGDDSATGTRSRALSRDPAGHGLKPGSEVLRGFAVFQRTCFACHTLNGQGDARLGPDLNIPHNPTEYLREDLLRAYIRDPQSLRRWPQARMPGFDRQALSDPDMDALLVYLRHMAGRKMQP